MIPFSRSCSVALLLLSVSGFANAVAAESAVITIDRGQPGPRLNPRMYGIFLEEINHGVDGGLYAELVRNRAFEDARPPEGYVFENGRWQDEHGFDSGYSRYDYTTNGAPFWQLVQEGDAAGQMTVETSGGVTEASAYCLRVQADSVANGTLGVANEGFFGMGIKAGQRYRFSLYARCDEGFGGSLTVQLEDQDGTPCSDTISMDGLGTEWRPFSRELTASRTDRKARLVMTLGDAGTVWFDFVSLFPTETWKGRANGLRADIAEMIAGLKPGFVRFPGGCVVEAGTVETAYNWKLTVGPLEHRQERWGPWNYRRTQGMGLFEYLRFCEDLGAEPLYVGFAGQTCIFRERELVPMDDMDWIVEDFLDVVEYANGLADSEWGAWRVRAGHPAPFDLKLVEIGNENQGRAFEERYNLIHKALKTRHPELTYLADLSWTSRESMSGAEFDIEDRHYYSSTQWFQSRYNMYDTRDRSLPPLYLGEVAVTSGEAGRLRGNLRAALAEGIFLLGCERNADVVQMVSYAPLLAHVDGRTELTGAPPAWHAMIYFDGLQSFGTVSYHLWRLFGENVPTFTMDSQVKFPDRKPLVVAGQVGIGTWDAVAEYKDIRVEREGQVLYASDFSQGADDWEPARGRWRVEGDAYRQGRRGQGWSYIGSDDWTDYTLSLKARKLAGGEGFLIVFGRRGEDRYWWNLGGWGNSRHAIEFNQTAVGEPVDGRIEDDRWYDIKVSINGARVRCYLDGELLHDVTVPEQRRFYAVAGVDEPRGEWVLKAINIGEESVSGTIDLQGVQPVEPTGSVAVLTAPEFSANNSLDDPERVVPRRATLEQVAAQFPYDFEPHSLTVMRLKVE